MIKLNVVGSRYWVDIPVLVIGIGNLEYIDGNENLYREVDIDDDNGNGCRWVFELVDSMLVARYVKYIKMNEEVLK